MRFMCDEMQDGLLAGKRYTARVKDDTRRDAWITLTASMHGQEGCATLYIESFKRKTPFITVVDMTLDWEEVE